MSVVPTSADAKHPPNARHLRLSGFNPLRRQVVPALPHSSPMDKKLPSNSCARLVWERGAGKTFFRETYGALGIPLLLVAIVCIVWTSWLIFLTLAPNEAANRLMNTGDYDNGQFWLIVEREPFVKWSSAFGFALVDVGYMAVLVKMFMFRSIVRRANIKETPKSWYVKVAERCNLQEVVKAWVDLTGYNAKYRKYFNVFLKAGDLSFQGLILLRTLEQGFPDTLAIGYAYFVCFNSFTCVLNILSAKNSAFAEVLIDSIFDLGAAVLFPMAVLGYCTYYFKFDREVFLVNVEVLDEGIFDRFARMQADPAQIALFRINFDSLRIKTAMDFTVCIGMNLSFCHRFSRVIEIMVTQRHQMSGATLGPTIVAMEEANRSFQKPVSRWFALPFLMCVAFSHVWNNGVNCSCLMLIDTNRSPRTAQDWYFPIDATEAVRALAIGGTLQGLQLINRQLKYFPDELRYCTGLETISLIYTSTEEIPSWVAEFKQLNFLHVEGKYDARNLVSLPTNLFSDLPMLTFLHLGNHYHLANIPSFDGVPNLRSLTLAVLLSVTELPPLKKLSRLEAFALVQVPQVPAIPDISSLVRLSRLTLYRQNHVCCNGFLGSCNLTDSYCMYDPVFNMPGATCLAEDDPRRANQAALEVIARFPYTVCQRTPPALAVEAVPNPESITMCGGVLYRQCEIPGVTSAKLLGMCYSARMQVVSCNVDQPFIQVRRLQIQRGVGLPCDPHEEAWLGCKAESGAL